MVVRGPVRKQSADRSVVGVRGLGVSVLGTPIHACEWPLKNPTNDKDLKECLMPMYLVC